MWRKINNNGLLGTIIFHAIIAAILLLLGFHTPLPLPEEKGILISFGDTPQGGGNIATSKPVIKKKQESKPKKTIAETPKNTPTPKPVISKTKAEQAPKHLTQNYQDAPAVKSSNTKNNTEELKKKKVKEQEQEKRKIEQEAKRKAEEEKKKKELEEKRKEEERKEEERRSKFANSMNSKAKNLFGKSNSTKEGNGNTYKSENQGSNSGSINGNINGSNNNGISYNLQGRSAEYIHHPNIDFTKGGKVVVEIIVNKTGKVVRATPGVIGTTTTDQKLYNIAKQSALKTRFNTSAKAAQHQKGTITYIFIVK